MYHDRIEQRLPQGRALQQHAARLALRDVCKRFGPRRVLQGVTLDVEPGEFVAVVGRSGCGKSTLLRLVAGVEHQDEGSVAYVGARPRVRMMFQDARLLPWRRVLANVALAAPGAGESHAYNLLAQVGMSGHARDWPYALSGGQRQRVALARALAARPDLLLLDEPLGAVDALTRLEMQTLIEGLWQQYRFTTLLVTHDVREAIALADRVLLIEDGVLALDLKVGLPRPRARASAAFLRLESQLLERLLRRGAQPRLHDGEAIAADASAFTHVGFDLATPSACFGLGPERRALG